MADASIEIEYNQEFGALTKLLSVVKRPGDFYASGSLTTPLPRLDIDGVGTVAFPVPDLQAREIIRHATQAPYGRGEQTLTDPKVRKVWQIAPEKFRLGGITWPETLGTILARTTQALGCQGIEVKAELYKLLLYDKGGFFISHRDTEKAEGMFGTLVIVMPAFHQGGELVIRHAGREVIVDLATKDVSQLNFAAFYADCEHEVRPILEGNRLCLIYNLLQQRTAKGPQKILAAPDDSREISAAATLLSNWSEQAGTPPKIVYLLEHQYTAATLSFSGLKNADAALGKVLLKAAQAAGFACHLGIVHIEESGAAEVGYEPHYRRSRWHRYEEEDDAEDAGNEDFEVVEVFDSRQYISNWVDGQDQPIDFGEIPLGKGELLPEGGLEGEAPDEQRVTEATGNEGASFDRSYHRAAIVLWQETRYPEVLLQRGAGAVIPYLKKRLVELDEPAKASRRAELHRSVCSLAKLVIGVWERQSGAYDSDKESKAAKRTEMLKLLLQMEDAGLIQEFIEKVITVQYDGSENAALAACGQQLGLKQAWALFSTLIEKNLPALPGPSIDLLKLLVKTTGRKSTPDVLAANRLIAEAAVRALTKVNSRQSGFINADWWRPREAKPLDGTMIATLFVTLHQLNALELSEEAAATISARPETFVPDTMLVPALSLLEQQLSQHIGEDPARIKLWLHSAEFLLARSEFPPVEPSDWSQSVKLECNCEDCRELKAFAKDPVRREHLFRVRKERRQHLHQTIERHGLDMTQQTERSGSPQTLVCVKTRGTYQRRCEQYAQDIQSFKTLAAMAGSQPFGGLRKRVMDAVGRAD